MIINGVELRDIDVTDALEMEHYESAHDMVSEKLKNYSRDGKRTSEIIRFQCETIFEFFEMVFGDGTAKKVFGESVNMTTCINAYEEVIKAVKQLDKKAAEQFKTRSGNRQQRRQKHNKKHKKNYNNNRPQLVQNTK